MAHLRCSLSMSFQSPYRGIRLKTDVVILTYPPQKVTLLSALFGTIFCEIYCFDLIERLIISGYEPGRRALDAQRRKIGGGRGEPSP